MDRVLLFLSIFGSLCWSLQPGLEYEYRYHGQVSSGITDGKKQLSAAGIEFDFTIQVTEDFHEIFKFSNIQVGDFHDVMTCEGCNFVPMEYNRLRHGVELLETSFRVLINESQSRGFIEVPKEPAWITNIRKAVVNIFRLFPFDVHDAEEEGVEELFHPDFSRVEETIFGNCRNWYSATKFQEFESIIFNDEHSLEEDIQREGAGSYTGGKGHEGARGHKGAKGRKTSKTTKSSKTTTSRLVTTSHAIQETLWRVTRSNDFDDCQTLVSMKAHLNKQTEDLSSRSSIGTYVIRGGSQVTLRIERAMVEGTVTLFTHEDHQRHFDTFTNQTIELNAVRAIEDQLVIDYEPRRFLSWNFEVEQTLIEDRVPSFQPTLEQLFTGVELKAEDTNNTKANVIYQVEALSHRMDPNQSHTESLVKEMGILTDAIELLNLDQLREIHSHFDNRWPRDFEEFKLIQNRMYIYHHSLIAAGTEPATSLLLDLVSQPDFRLIYPESVFELFQDLSKMIKSSNLFHKLMALTIKLEWDIRKGTRGHKAAAILGFSKLVNKLCFNPERRLIIWENTCEKEHICDHEEIINTYIPYLKQQMNVSYTYRRIYTRDDESLFGKRHFYLQALGSLGTPLIIEILQPYIIGTTHSKVVFRMDAIFSLSKGYLPPVAKGQVMGLLMPIFNNFAEDHRIRSVAFLVMSSWETNESWWHRMARATWRDPSVNVANMMSTTIKTVALMDGGRVPLAKVASRVEHLVKPSSPASTTYFHNYYFLDYLYMTQFDKPLTFSWLANSASILPSTIVLRLHLMNYLGYSQDTSITLKYAGLTKPLLTLMQTMIHMPSIAHDDTYELINRIYSEIKEALGTDSARPPDVNEELLFLARLNGEFIYMLHHKSRIPLPGQWRMYDIGQIRILKALTSPNFERDVYAYVAVPTALGLPLISQYTFDYAFWVEASDVSGDQPGKGGFNVKIDLSNRLNVEVKTLIPWSEKFAVGTGAEHQFSYHIPFALHYDFNKTDSEMTLTLKPLINDRKVHIIDGHWAPFTAQYGNFPTTAHLASAEHKLFRKYDKCQYKSKYQLFHPNVGIWTEVETGGDIQNSLSFLSFYSGNVFKPDLQSYKFHVVFDPVASTTKSISFTFIYVSTKRSGSGGASGDIEDEGQVSQSGVDYADYSQFSQSAGGDYEDLGDTGEFAEEMSAIRQRITKLQDQVLPASGGHVRTIGVEINLEGETDQKYESILSWATGTSHSKKKNNLQVTWMKGIPEGVLQEQLATCFNAQVEKPYLLPFPTVDDVLNADYHATVNIDVHDCINGLPPVLEIEGTMDISEDKMNEIRRQLSKDCGPQFINYPIDILTSPLYDIVHIKAKWAEEFPIEFKNMTYRVYDMIRGIRYPEIYYDYTAENPDRLVEVHASKCLETQDWNIHISKPQELSIMENVRMPYLLDVFASPATMKETLIYDFFNGRHNQVCEISTEKVRTYDGLEFPYHPDSCWSVISMDRFGSGYDQIILKSRFHDDQWEVQIIIPLPPLLLEMTKSTFKVNGEDFQGDYNGRFEVTFLENGTLLTSLFNDHIMVSDKILILPNPLLKSSFVGLCGNFDGVKTNDMIGPKGCIYTNPDLFSKSWSTSGEGCSGFSFLGKKRPVETYQDACPRRDSIPTGIGYPNLVNDCLVWRFEERSSGTHKCKALIPTASCKLHCQPDFIKTYRIQYDCQETDLTKQTSASKCYLEEFPTASAGTCSHS